MSRKSSLQNLRRKLSKVVGTGSLESVLNRQMDNAESTEALESLSTSEGSDSSMDSLMIPDLELRSSALRKLEDGDFDNITPREQQYLEAVVEEEGRPVVCVIDNRFDALSEPWAQLNEGPVCSRINSAMPAIGRIENISRGIPQHIGTGFIVGPNLMMTNRHVAEMFVRGIGRDGKKLSFVPGIESAINFQREKEQNPNDTSASIRLTEVVMIHPYWDMAIFRIAGGASSANPLRLSVIPPEDLIGRQIVVIGYPGRGKDRSRKAIQLERKYFGDLFGVKRLAPGEIDGRDQIESFGHLVPAMIHDSSTLAGNSGSAIIDVETGDVVGLHFKGATLKANYSVPIYELARDSRVINAGLNFSGSVPTTTAWEDAWRGIESLGDGIIRSSGFSPMFPATPLGNSFQQTSVLTIPIQITISIGQVAQSPTPNSEGASPESGVVSRQESAVHEATYKVPIIYPRLEDREGYDPGFLDLDGGERVPLPDVTEEGSGLVSKLADGSHELKYHRFSVVMHKQRRLALFTASNVSWQREDKFLSDGRKPSRRQLNGFDTDVAQEGWVSDHRIPLEEQLPDKFYIKDQGHFDRGHLVRRDDVAWGESFEQMQKGNGDTFHTTNCSPQVADFNQALKGVDNWGDLETLIERETTSERVTVFSGPVLDPSDEAFIGVDDSGQVKIQIPKQFWKIVVAKTDDGPKAFGFVLRQKLSSVPLEFAIPDDWEPYQVQISEIEEMLFGLASLDWCKRHDALG
jgi:endonuclease G